MTTPKSRRGFWKMWPPIETRSADSPLFAATMWYGFAHDFEDIGLYAIAMAIGTFHIGELTVLCFHRIREWQEQSDR